MKPPSEDVLQATLPHVRYEIEMLLGCDELRLDPPQSRVLQRAVIEATLLHYRVLRDVFLEPRRLEGAVQASHFGLSKQNIARSEAHRDAINERLTHLSYSRAGQDTEPEWPAEELVKPVLRQALRLCDHLLPGQVADAAERAKWEALQRRLQGVATDFQSGPIGETGPAGP